MNIYIDQDHTFQIQDLINDDIAFDSQLIPSWDDVESSNAWHSVESKIREPELVIDYSAI